MLKVIVKSNSLLVESLGSFKYSRVMSPTNKDNLTSFLLCIPFISLKLLFYSNFTTVLNKTSKSRHSHIVTNFRDNAFSFSPITTNAYAYCINTLC